MDDITQDTYDQEISELSEQIASDIVEEHDGDRDACEEAMYDRLHETVDGHQWIIYNAHNLQVLQFSQNTTAMVDDFGEEHAGHVLAERGMDGLHQVAAFCAMEADVRDLLTDRLEEALESFEAEQQRMQDGAEDGIPADQEEVCGTCILMIANGEAPPDYSEEQADALGETTAGWTYGGGTSDSFSTHPCHCCGDKAYGERFGAYAPEDRG